MAVTSVYELRTARARMVAELLVSRGIRDQRVLAVMARIERHRFLAASLLDRAYGPYTLPIGDGQSTPHPYTVALMAQALALGRNERVLEIGAGCGYQTAVLAGLAGEVWSTEQSPVLANLARLHLAELAVNNAHVITQAGLTVASTARFDAIHVSAAMPEVPGQLLARLRRGGRLIAPVGLLQHQRLLLLENKGGGEIVTRTLTTCRFRSITGPQNERLAPGHRRGNAV